MQLLLAFFSEYVRINYRQLIIALTKWRIDLHDKSRSQTKGIRNDNE